MHIVLSAMDQELALIKEQAKIQDQITWNGFIFYRASLFGKEVLLGKSGVGKVLSAMVAQHLIEEYSPPSFIFTGLAGALNPKLQIGDILIGREFIQHDMDASALGFKRGEIPFSGYHIIEAEKGLLKIGESFCAKEHDVMIGRILSGDQFIHAEMQHSQNHLRNEMQGDAVEMEGASVALVCAINKVPFIIARTISDRADHTAVINFNEFLPIASKNSLEFVKHMLSKI